jgi:hypothetical protein
MTKIHQHQHESLLSLAAEGEEVGNRVCQILADMDAHKSVQRIKVADYSYASENTNIDQVIVRKAMSFVEYAEDAVIELTEVTSRRKMANTPEHLILALRAQQLGLRLYRNLWELALSEGDRAILRRLMQRTSTLQVWEDLPATCHGRSYERVTNGMNGVIAYSHAYGVTYMQYKRGVSIFGWSVLRDTLEEAVLIGRDILSLKAERLLGPNPKVWQH